MASFLFFLITTFSFSTASDGEDDESCSSVADYTSIAGSCLTYVSEESLQESERDLIAGVITLDEFILAHYDYACQIHRCEGSVIVRWNLLRHCMRVIVDRNLVKDVSFHAGMRSFVGLISRGSPRRSKCKHLCRYQMAATQGLMQFADDIYSFVLQTLDADYIHKLKPVFLLILVLHKKRSNGLDFCNHRALEITKRVDEIYAAMDAAVPGSESQDKLKDLYSAICCHFVHRPRMDVVLTAVQHQRMMDFIADEAPVGSCQTFIKVLRQRNRSFFPHPAIIKMMQRLLNVGNLSKENDALDWMTTAVAAAKRNPKKLIM